MPNADATGVPPSSTSMFRLTERQRDCLRLLAQGYRIKEIAIQLGNSPETVKQHLAAARKLLNSPSSAQAARTFAIWEREEVGPSDVAGSGFPQISAGFDPQSPPPKEVNPPELLVDPPTTAPIVHSSRAWRRWLGPFGWLIPAYRGAINDLSTVQRIIVLIILPLAIILVSVGALASYETLLRLLIRSN